MLSRCWVVASCMSRDDLEPSRQSEAALVWGRVAMIDGRSGVAWSPACRTRCRRCRAMSDASRAVGRGVDVAWCRKRCRQCRAMSALCGDWCAVFCSILLNTVVTWTSNDLDVVTVRTRQRMMSASYMQLQVVVLLTSLTTLTLLTSLVRWSRVLGLESIDMCTGPTGNRPV